MSVKRKISVRKILQALLTLVLTGVCIAAVLSATKLQSARKLNEVNIQINNSDYGFVTKADVATMLLKDRNVQLKNTKLSSINVKQMEQVIKESDWVEDAQVYIDNKHNLHALVTQRIPVVRIFEKNGDSYYLDRKMEALPLSAKYNYYTTVVTNVPNLRDSANAEVKAQIMAMTRFIKADTFWNAQVSQLIVNDDLTFEIVPVLGDHKIIMGDTTDMKLKFDNLFAFYTKVLNEVGWDKYQVLDLSYKGQLVASPSLNWKMPVDKVINRINWVNSILGDGTKTLTAPKLAKEVQLAVPKENVTITVAKPETVATVKPVSAPVAAPAKKDIVAKPTTKPASAKPLAVAKKEVVVKPAAKPATVKPSAAVKKEVTKKPASKPFVKKEKAVKKAAKPVVKKKKQSEAKAEKTEQVKEDKKPKYIYNGQ